jgi:hypothetical protein
MIHFSTLLTPQSSKLIATHEITIGAIAQQLKHRGVDRRFDKSNRPIAESEIRPAWMAAAESTHRKIRARIGFRDTLVILRNGS